MAANQPNDAINYISLFTSIAEPKCIWEENNTSLFFTKLTTFWELLRKAEAVEAGLNVR